MNAWVGKKDGEKMNGVFLDTDTLKGEDLDWTALRQALPNWQWHGSTTPAQLPARVAGAEVIVSNKVRIDAAALDAAPALKLICVAATGTNNIDLDAAHARGIRVCNARNYSTMSVAQHTLTLMLMLATRMHHYHADVRSGRWSAQTQFCLLDHPVAELQGRTLTLVGYGDIGKRVAQLAEAFGMRVIVAQIPGRPADGARLPLDETLPISDVLSLHCPLSEQTRLLINAERLSRMKKGAWLVNVARGGIVDEQALHAALCSGQLGGAALDVLEREPPPADHPLLQLAHPRLIITPHNAWGSQPARQMLLNQIAENINAFRAGQSLRVVI